MKIVAWEGNRANWRGPGWSLGFGKLSRAMDVKRGSVHLFYKCSFSFGSSDVGVKKKEKNPPLSLHARCVYRICRGDDRRRVSYSRCGHLRVGKRCYWGLGSLGGA